MHNPDTKVQERHPAVQTGVEAGTVNCEFDEGGDGVPNVLNDL